MRGSDYEYPKAGGDRLATFKNELRGSGPFLHDDPVDRPPEVFAGTVTLHAGGPQRAHLLVPLIPHS